METLRIGYTDIIFKDDGPGRGKLMISDDDWGYNFSYFWGSTGKDTLKEFIASTNVGYFTGKLSPNLKGPLDVKKTFRNIRASLKESFEASSLYWYHHQEFQKDMREALNDVQSEVCDDRGLIDSLDSIENNVNFFLIDDSYDRKIIESIFNNISCECWYMFEYAEPREHKFLEKLHKKLVKHIKNEQKRAVKV